jgi:squalene synthase HpnC
MAYLVTSSMVSPAAAPSPDLTVPATVRAAFAPPCPLGTAQQYTRRLALGHYENFSVLSVLLPRHLRQHFANVYAFCRTADDLGDEVSDKFLALQYLARFKDFTRACYAGEARSPLFVALGETIRQFDIPIDPFLDLIDAFEQDQHVSRYENFEQVVDYCRRSADPVGRLVLYMCGYCDTERQQLSDRTCTALQLANFWQDVRRDILERDRIYLPADSMQHFEVDEDQIRNGHCTDNYRSLIRFEVDRTQKLFDDGDALLPLLEPTVRRQVSLFGQGGKAVLEAIRRQNYDTLSKRPSISKWRKGRLVIRALMTGVASRLDRRIHA